MGDSPEVPELTQKQREVIRILPASTHQIKQKLGVAETTARGHIRALRNKGIDVEYDHTANQYFLEDNRKKKLRQISTKHKQTKTREATQIIEEEESILLRKLNSTEPLTARPAAGQEKESFCAVLGDLHFGDVVEKEFWDDEKGQYVDRKVYDSSIAADAVRHYGEKLLYLKELMSSVSDFDDCYLFLLGDIATGEGIYEGQVHDVEDHLADQTTKSVDSLFQLCTTLADEFETLQVRGVLGNHGKSRASSHHGSNTDLITYRWLDYALRKSGYENISLAAAEAHHHLNTKVRDWRYHVRHGQETKEHVDETSYSGNQWKGWRDEHKFDLAMKGHHHSPAFHKVMNKYPVFSSPSPKPGDEFASKIGSPDVSLRKDLGWAFGVSDERPVTWKFLVNEDIGEK